MTHLGSSAVPGSVVAGGVVGVAVDDSILTTPVPDAISTSNLSSSEKYSATTGDSGDWGETGRDGCDQTSSRRSGETLDSVGEYGARCKGDRSRYRNRGVSG